MTKEVPLQTDMFTGDLVDNRTRKQKKKAKEQQRPKQTEMFSQREMAQFGVNPRPQLPLSPKTPNIGYFLTLPSLRKPTARYFPIVLLVLSSPSCTSVRLGGYIPPSACVNHLLI